MVGPPTHEKFDGRPATAQRSAQLTMPIRRHVPAVSGIMSGPPLSPWQELWPPSAQPAHSCVDGSCWTWKSA